MSNLSGMSTPSITAFMTAVSAVLEDPSTSNSLRQRVQSDIARDPLDALSDAERHLDLCRMRVKEVFGANKINLLVTDN